MEKEQEQLKKLAQIFNTGNVITADQVKEVLTGIVAIMGSYKGDTEKLNSDTKQGIVRMVEKLKKDHADVLADVESKNKKLKESVDKAVEAVEKKLLTEADVKAISDKIISDKIAKDHESLVSDVLSKITIPEFKETVLDGPVQLANKLETLTGDERLKATAIAGLEEMIDQRIASSMGNMVGGRGGSFKNTIGGGVTRIKVVGAGITMTSTYGDRGMGVVTLTVSGGGGGGSPGGSDTQVQFNDGGSFGGDAGMTYNKTTDTLTLAGPINMETANIEDSDASHYLVIRTTSNLTANRNFTIVPGDAARTLTMAGDFATEGGFSTTLTTTANSNVTLPKTGTLATLAGTETLSNKTLDEAKIINGGFIKDANNNELLIFTTTASAVNELTFNNAATGNNPRFLASGGDTNIGIDLTAKGTGSVNICGNSTLAGELRIYEDTDDGSNYSAFRGSPRSANITYLMPTGDPTSGQALTAGAPSSNVSQLSWTTISGMSIGGTVTSGTTGSVLFIGASSALAEDNANFFWDDTNNYLGIGTNTPGRTLHVKGDVSGGIATLERTNASTNAVVGTAVIRGTSTGDMVDGFGSAFQFALQDNAGVENIIAAIRAYRSGADNSAAMDFVTYLAGASGIAATFTAAGDLVLTPRVRTTGSPTGLTFTGPAHTTLTASTEASDVLLSLARTVQFATGALTNQRAVYITAPTYAFVGASTITTASTVSISGAPVAGTNATITNAYALDVISGISHVGGVLALAVGSATAPSLYFDGNNTAGFYSPTSGMINFTVNSAARWTINSSNIVSTTNGAQLNRSQGTNGLIFTQQGDTNTGIGMPGTDVLNLITGGTKALTADASQNIGIGVASGSITAGLHIRASTTSSASMCIAAGTAPTSPNEGDMWNNSTQKTLTGFFAGVTQFASGVLFTATATATIANTTTETTVFGSGVGTLTLPANFFTAGKTIRIMIGGVFSTLVTPGNLTVKVKLGSTTIATVTISNLLASASNNAFQVQGDITCRSTGGSGTVMVNGNINYDTGTLVRGVAPLNNAGATTTIDTTASQALSVTVQWATASASNTISATTATVEVLS